MPSSSLNTLRLVQFNVENLFLTLDHYKNQDLKKINEAEWRKFSSSTTPNKSLRKTWALAEILKEIDADIVMLNEVGGIESLENFNRLFLDGQYQVYLKEGNSLRGIDVGYLIKSSLPLKPLLISHKDRPIHFLYPHETKTPAGGKSHYFSRDVAELRLFSPGENSPTLVILLTHLKSKLDSDRIDAEGKLRRAAELKSLVSLYNEIKNELGDKVPMLVAGDFNGTASPLATDPEFLPIYENSDLQDVLHIINYPSEKRYTQVQIMPGGQRQLIQLDYIMTSPHLVNNIAKEQTYVYRFKDPTGAEAVIPRTIEERSIYASDHYPVVLTLVFTK